jgi:UTP-glucose-1-phosphate uridylyltransferase
MKNNGFTSISLMGGKGTRFNPITHYMPKEFLPVIYEEHKDLYHKKNVGSEIIVCQLDQMENLGIKDKVIVISPEKLNHYKNLENRWKDLSKESNLAKKIYETIKDSKLIIQEKPLGDGDAIYLALKNSTNDKALVYYGDLIYNTSTYKKDFKKAIEKFEKENYDVLYFTKFIKEDPSRFGVFKIKDGKVISIVEKPKENLEYLLSEKDGVKGYFINTGILLMNKERILPILEKEREYFSQNKDEELVFTKVIAKHLHELRVGIYNLSEQEKLEDYGTFKDYVRLLSKHLENLNKY